MEPIEYVRIFRRRWATIAVACVLGAVIAWAVTPAHPKQRAKTYQAAATLIVNQQATGNVPSLPQLALLTTTGDVPLRAAAHLHDTGDPAALASHVSATADTQVGALKISSTSTDPARAALLANTFADSLSTAMDEKATADYQKNVKDVSSRLDELKAAIARFDATSRPTITSSGGPGDISTAERDALVNQYRLAYDQFQQLAAQGPPTKLLNIIQRATPSAVADNSFRAPTSRRARLLIGFLGGLVLGSGLVLLLERIDIRIRTKSDAEEAYGLPVIAEIPALARARRRRHEIMTVKAPGSPFAEAYRILRTLLLLTRTLPAAAPESMRHLGVTPVALDHDLQVVLVTSAGPAEGKTTTVAHLAVALAETGRSVMVLSCDFRRPRVHKMFDVGEGAGVTDVLAGRVRLRDVVRQTSVKGVHLVTTGTPVDSPAELIAAGAREFIQQARDMVDIVLVDTAPLLVANDASELMPDTDAVLVITRSGKTTGEAAQRSAELLDRVGAPVLGVVLTAAPQAMTAHRYYYYRYYVKPDGVMGWRRMLRRSPKEIEPLPAPEPLAPADLPHPTERAAPERRSGRKGATSQATAPPAEVTYSAETAEAADAPRPVGDSEVATPASEATAANGHVTEPAKTTPQRQAAPRARTAASSTKPSSGPPAPKPAREAIRSLWKELGGKG